MNSSSNKVESENIKSNESKIEAKSIVHLEKHKPEEKKKGIYKNLISGVSLKINLIPK